MQETRDLGSPGGSAGKEPTCNAADPGSIPGLGRSAGEGNTTHSSMLGLLWRSDSQESSHTAEALGSIPGLGRFPSRRAWKPTPVSLAGESPQSEEAWGQSLGLRRVGHDWSTQCTSQHVLSPTISSRSLALARPTLCDPVDYSMPGFLVLRDPPDFAQTHVHWVSN